ncbi:hypothetical protein KFK09_020525 [Dendrobium nobile]|uniref:Uncharacterized protein n=1 Tax=Dendrobium nobile TaxID=94219 RepID=A0A8T3ANF0_DENNO|nr:hypothetical protein KFK09_020525 [Dendrobium nobile]
MYFLLLFYIFFLSIIFSLFVMSERERSILLFIVVVCILFKKNLHLFFLTIDFYLSESLKERNFLKFQK